MSDLPALLGTLCDHDAEFIIIGGVAAVAHGSSRLTQDIDVVYSRTEDNLGRVVAALGPYSPYLRGAPPGLPFEWSLETLQRGLNFTLTTSIGDIDLFGEIIGGGGYQDLLSGCVTLEFFGHRCLCLDLPTLLRVKRAAGRPHDLEVIAELEALIEEREKD